MREYAKVSARFWINEQGRKIRKLGITAQLISLYLITNPHATMIGIYYLPVALLAHETGFSIEESLHGLENLSEIGFCRYDQDAEYVWVCDMAFEQISTQLKQNDNRVKAVNDAVAVLPYLPFLQEFHDKYADVFFLRPKNQFNKDPLKALASQEQYQEKEQNQEMFISDSSNLFFDDEYIKRDGLLEDQANEILQFLNEKTGRVYRPVEANLKLIIARLRTGASVMDCRQVIAKKTREWKGDAKMSEYLRPATLFNSIKFEQYMGELVMPNEDLSNDIA